MAVRVGFAGTNWWAAQALERLLRRPGIDVAVVLSQPDRPAGRGRKPAPPPVAVAADELGIELTQPERAADALPLLPEPGSGPSRSSPTGCSFRGRMLDALPFVNLHPSALPRWRGAAPVERSLMAGEHASAVAAMLLVEQLDAGPVAAMERFDVGPDEDAGAVYERALSLGLPPLAAALADAGAGRLATVPQVGEPTYADKITAADRVLDAGTARARAARPRARALAAHRRAPVPRRARLCDLADIRARARARRRALSSATATRSCSAAATARSSCARCSRRAAAGCPQPTGCAACRGALPAVTSA